MHLVHKKSSSQDLYTITLETAAYQCVQSFLIEIEIVRCVPKPYFLNLDALTMRMMRLIFYFFSFFFPIPIFAFKSKNCLLLLTSCNRFREKNYNQTSGDALQHELSIVSHMNSNCKMI